MHPPDSPMPANSGSDETIFAAALRWETPAQRAAYLDEACAGDPALRARVEALLRADADAGTFLERPVGRPPAAGAATLRVGFSELLPVAETPGARIGRYKLLQQIGEGGCGTVFMAEQEEPVRRRVALKVIKLGMDTRSVVARFEAERQALALMDHPNIAKVLDAGATDSGRPFFVMELVRGIPITRYCDENRLATQARLDLFIRVCHAIQHAHQKGIIHRDIKPSNILVTLHDGQPVPKVIDFGIAKATEGRLTERTLFTAFEQFIGTPAYMSPEQAEMSGLDIDTRSDIYALGVLLYELLTGRTPFDAKELAQAGLDEMRRRIREVEPQRPSTRLSTLQGEALTTTASAHGTDMSRLLNLIRGDLDWIVMKCLEKDRTRRYETANGLAADLKRHLSNEPVVARPPSAAYQLQKAFRRNKLAFAAGAAVLAALVFGLALTLWQYAGKSRAERGQVQLREQAEARAREAAAARTTAEQQRELAQARLYESLVREAGSLRKARQIGYREDVFARLRQALPLAPAGHDPVELRREASACFGDWLGLAPVDLPAGKMNPWMAALAPDGSLAAVQQDYRRIVLYGTRDGRELATLATGGTAFTGHFDASGRALFVVTFGSDFEWGRRPRDWHLEKWVPHGDGSWRREWRKPLAGMGQFADTRAGPLLVEARGGDRQLVVVEPDTGSELAVVPNDSPLPWLPSFTLSPDRRHLAFFSLGASNRFDVRVEVWNLTDRRRVAELQPQLSAGWALEFSPDGLSLVATFENTVLVYDAATFAVSLNQGGSFEGTLGSTAGGTGGLLAIPSTQELAVRLVPARSGSELAYLKLPGSPVLCRFSRDGSMLLVTHARGTRLVRLGDGREKLRLTGHQGGVPAAVFTPDGRRLVSAGKDRTLRVWDPAAGTGQVLAELPAPGQSLALTPDGSQVWCGHYNLSDVSLRSLADGGLLTTLSRRAGLTNDPGTTWSLMVSRDGRRLCASGYGLQVWELAGSGPAALLLAEPNASAGGYFDAPATRVFYGDWNRTDQYLARGTMTLNVRELAGGAGPRVLATDGMDNFVQNSAVHPRTGELLYFNKDRELVALDAATGRKLRAVPTRPPGSTDDWFVANFQISPDGAKIANLTLAGLGVEIRDATTGRLLYVLPEESGTIWWLAWAPDSQRLAVTRGSGSIDVWHLPEVEARLAELGLKP
jgi:WD40 repeat protein